MAEEFDLADLKIEDSNLAGIGSDEDKSVRKNAAMTEPAWQGCGMEPGLEIWRIEQFKVVPWPKEEYGHFYEGDSYIVLKTTKSTEEDADPDALVRDIFFWLGLKSTTDEQGTAAYKTVELDDLFDGEATQHREVMKHETSEFKALFPKITYLKGGVASGFKHVETGAYVPRLLLVKRFEGKVHVGQVPTECASLNEGDAFVLDAGANIYTWFGSSSSPFEKQAANTLAENLENDRSGKAKVSDNHDDDFWALLGGKGEIKQASDVPLMPEPKPVGEGVLYRLSDSTGDLKCEEVGRGDLKKSMLETSDVYVCDPGNQLMIWVGKGASPKEQRTAMVSASKFLRFQDRPLTTPVMMVREGQKFKAPFSKIFSN